MASVYCRLKAINCCAALGSGPTVAYCRRARIIARFCSARRAELTAFNRSQLMEMHTRMCTLNKKTHTQNVQM